MSLISQNARHKEVGKKKREMEKDKIELVEEREEEVGDGDKTVVDPTRNKKRKKGRKEEGDEQLEIEEGKERKKLERILGLEQRKKQKKTKKKEPAMIKDERFASAQSDPRFMEAPKRHSKVTIDSRFQRVFTDRNFISSRAPVDKRGKPKANNTSSSSSLAHYYRLHQEDVPESDAQIANPAQAKTDIEKMRNLDEEGDDDDDELDDEEEDDDDGQSADESSSTSTTDSDDDNYVDQDDEEDSLMPQEDVPETTKKHED